MKKNGSVTNGKKLGLWLALLDEARTDWRVGQYGIKPLIGCGGYASMRGSSACASGCAGG